VPPAAEVAELLRACLKLLALPVRGGGAALPERAPLWRVAEALAQLRARLPWLPTEGVPLAALLPPRGDAEMRTPLQRRAALASAFLAGLELEREGAVSLAHEKGAPGLRLLPRAAV